MPNFEASCWNFSWSTNLKIGRSVVLLVIVDTICFCLHCYIICLFTFSDTAIVETIQKKQAMSIELQLRPIIQRPLLIIQTTHPIKIHMLRSSIQLVCLLFFWSAICLHFLKICLHFFSGVIPPNADYRQPLIQPPPYHDVVNHNRR